MSPNRRGKIDRRTAIVSGLATIGAVSVPGPSVADDAATKFTPGYEGNEPPSENVDVTTVSPFSLPGQEPTTVPTGNFIDHTIFGIGGTRAAAEWWRDETTMELQIGDEYVGDVSDSEYTEIVMREDLELADGTVIPECWGLQLNYVVSPKPPGTYTVILDIIFPTDSPDRGERFGESRVIEAGTGHYLENTYEVAPRRENGR